MHPRTYREFERICTERKVGGSVLEMGAVPSPNSLLCMKSLKNATEKVGVNINGPQKYRDFNILKGNANFMSFEDNKFDLVLCNGMLEHDKYFWKSIEEMKRVTKPGGLIIIGTPGYVYFRIEKLKSILGKITLLKKLKKNQYLNMFFTATITYQVHNSPGDYYRFSAQTFKELFFEGMDDVEIRSIALPPRIIGVGRKKMNTVKPV